MRKRYTTIVVFGVMAQIALLIFFDEKIGAYGPVIFWVLALFGILNYTVNIFRLSSSMKKTNPELFKKHSFGIVINRNALSDKAFLNALSEEEREIIENNKIIIKYLYLCFGLFVISSIFIVSR